MEGDQQAAPVTDSTASVEAATAEGGQAAEQDAVTHGDGTEQAAESTSSESSASDDDDDAETEPSETDTPEEAKSKAEKRRERRRAREQERIDKAVEERLAEAEAKRKADQEEADRQSKTEAAVKARQEKFSKFLGTPESNRALQDEIASLSNDLTALTADPEYDTDQGKIDRAKEIAASLQAKRSDLARLAENNEMSDLIWSDIWDTVGGDFASAAAFPELAKDAKLQARYLKAEGGVRGALSVLRDILQADWKAQSDAEMAEVKKAHKVELDAMTQQARTWMQRAGGSELDGVGAGAPAPGAMTRAQFMSLPREQKERMRREQPALVADIYARSA